MSEPDKHGNPADVPDRPADVPDRPAVTDKTDKTDKPGEAGEADPARMRAADADRDRVADRLREALAEGRLTVDEHAERLDAVYQAKTYADLAPIVADLPTTSDVPTPEPGPVLREDLPTPQAGSPNIVAVLSGAERRGRWLVEPQTNVVAVCGGVELDLRQAVLSRREVTINIVAVLGGVTLTVPAGVRVVDSIAGVLGGCSIPPADVLDPDAPVIRLTGMALLGGVDVKRRGADDTGGWDPPAEGDFRRQERHIHREFRRKQREIHREFQQRRRELRRARRHGR